MDCTQAPLFVEFSRLEYWSGFCSLLQGIFLTQGSNPGLPHCRQILYQLSYQGSKSRDLEAVSAYVLRRALWGAPGILGCKWVS